MKRTTRLKNILVFHPGGLSVNWQMAFLGTMLVAGVLIGSLIARGLDESSAEIMGGLFGSFSDKRTDQSILTTFWNALGSNLPLLIIAAFLGVCAVGTVLIPLLPLFKGLGLGVLTGYLYVVQGFKGVAFSALLIAPVSVLASLILLVGCREAMKFSSALGRQIIPSGKNPPERPELRPYLMRFFALFVLLSITALIDAVLSALFLRFFS